MAEIPIPGHFLNSGVNLTNIYGTIDGVTLDDNRFLSCGKWFAICDDSNQGSSTIVWAATNNGFYQCASPRRGNRSKETISPNSGNYTMSSLNATSGTLIKGEPAPFECPPEFE